MENIKMHEFKHPNYYKELRKRNKSDQVISSKNRDGECERAPGPGLVCAFGRKATSDSTGGVPGNADITVTSLKLQTLKPQVTSLKPQGARLKLQATSVKLHDTFTLIKFYKVKGDCLG